MVRVDIETIIMASAPLPSVVILRERAGAEQDSPLRALSIHTGAYEAAAIGHGLDGTDEPRPITHDVIVDALSKLGCTVERVEITRVDAPVFYAALILQDKDGEEISVDARPSDALGVAVRSNAPIFVEDDVMNRAGSASLSPQEASEDELERFDEFVHTLSPEDF